MAEETNIKVYLKNIMIMITKRLKEKTTFVKYLLLIAGLILPMYGCTKTYRHYTLEELIHSAYQKYPYANRLTLMKEQNLESKKVINTQWLPHTSISIKGSGQSEISSVNIPKSIENKFGIDIDEGEKIQYQGELAVSQLIYDGGTGSIKKRINNLNNDTETCQIESQMLQIEDNIDNLFENILITKEQIKAVLFKKADLELRKKDIESAIKNGISLKTDLQEIEANIIQLNQQETELEMSQQQQYITLSSYTQETVDSNAVLDLPVPADITDRNYLARPDYQIFSLQLQNAEYKQKELNAEFIPKISLFANGYYGRPGLNMMNYSNHCSGIIGVSMTWNIDALYKNSHQRNMINIDQEKTRNQQSIYEININRQIDNLNINMAKNMKLTNSDDKIIKIRSNIKNIASIQLKNGTITLTDYLIKLNDEAQAIVNKSIHHIEYLMDGAKMKTLLNKNN
jgi:outer membrane protein TolC